MYLYQATSKTRPDGLPMKGPSTLSAKIVNREINNSVLLRDTLKDTTSSKLQVKGPKQAEALHLATTLVLRQQIANFSEGLLEHSRTNYLLEQNDRRRSLQEFQCNFLIKLANIVKLQILERGESFRKYQIGGYDGGTYEKFFKIEPARYMSKAQLLTALRLTFGNDLMKSEAVIGKLFDSFDFNHTDKMDWRGFLILFSILMQPLLSYEELIRLSYALYSSFGYLDLNCIDSLSLGVLKAMLCAPVQLSLRNAVMNAFDQGWKELTEQDKKVLEYIAHKKQLENNAKNLNPNRDPDDFKITFTIFQKILKKTSFAYLLETKTVFGKRDQRSWTYVFEEEYYHPIILRQVKKLRREYRNEDEADQFIAQCEHRKKRILLAIWKLFIQRRISLRNVLIAAEIRSTVSNLGTFFDHWRKLIIQMIATQEVQRVVRGFIARKRKHFIKRLQRKVIRIQAHSRQLLQRQHTNRAKTRLFWAAVTIQRNYRGRYQRKRIVTMIEAVFDTQKRLLSKEKRQWIELRRLRAIIRIQVVIRNFLRRRRFMKKLLSIEQQDRVTSMMEEQRLKNELMIKLYKQEVSLWYRKRKEVYDETVISERTTKLQKKKILERKQAAIQLEKQRKEEIRALQLAKLEEERIEHWIKQWELKIIERGESYRKKCSMCLLMPETPEDILLKKYLQKEIKSHIKEVLRIADKQKIPMEIPEAYQIATKEIIEKEVEKELERAKQSMKEEADRLQEEEHQRQLALEQKAKDEKKRRKKWAVVTLQTHVRSYLSRHRMVKIAKMRYNKLFHQAYHEYYYQDKLHPKKLFWDKPRSLGSYDITMDDYWIIMHCYQEEHRRKQEQTQLAAAGGGALVTYQSEESNSPDAMVVYQGPHAGGGDGSGQGGGGGKPMMMSLASTNISIDDQRTLFYYYNPSTWEQTWEQPRGTILCDTCHVEFAKIYYKPTSSQPNLSSDMFRDDMYHFYYCDLCFHAFSTQLATQYQIHPREIMIQIFDGGSSFADYLDFHQISFSNWYSYSTQLDASLKLSSEEEALLIQKEHEAKEARLKGFCRLCEYEACRINCIECDMNYCKTCCSMEHKRKAKRYHTLYKMKADGTLKLMVKKGKDSDEDGKKKKKKKKKNKKKDSEGVDGEKKKKKKKKKDKPDDSTAAGNTSNNLFGKLPSLFNKKVNINSDSDSSNPSQTKKTSSDPISLPPIAKSASFKDKLPSIFSSAGSGKNNPTNAISDSETSNPETAAEDEKKKKKKDKKDKKKKKKKKEQEGGDSSATEGEGVDGEKKKKKKKKKKKDRDDSETEVSDYGGDSEADGPKKKKKKKDKKPSSAPGSLYSLDDDSSADDSSLASADTEDVDKKKKKKKKKDKTPLLSSTVPLAKVPEGEDEHDNDSVAYESSDYYNSDYNSTAASGYYSSTDYATSAYDSTDYASDA